MYHSSYIKTLALQLNILLEAATASSNYDCIFQGLHLFQTINVELLIPHVNTTTKYRTLQNIGRARSSINTTVKHKYMICRIEVQLDNFVHKQSSYSSL